MQAIDIFGAILVPSRTDDEEDFTSLLKGCGDMLGKEGWRKNSSAIYRYSIFFNKPHLRIS